jgi:hypothetical protein
LDKSDPGSQRDPFERFCCAVKGYRCEQEPSHMERKHWKNMCSAQVRLANLGAPVQNHRPWLRDEIRPLAS